MGANPQILANFFLKFQSCITMDFSLLFTVENSKRFLLLVLLLNHNIFVQIFNTSLGYRIRRADIRESLQRIDPVGRALRRRRVIYRRSYSVPCPNYIWLVNTSMLHNM